MIRLAVRCRPELAERVLAELVQLAPNGVEQQGLLDHFASRVLQLHLPADLVRQSILNVGEGVQVLDFGPGLQAARAFRPNGDVAVAAQGAFLHVAVGHAQIEHDQPEHFQVRSGLLRGAQVGLGDYFQEGNARPVLTLGKADAFNPAMFTVHNGGLTLKGLQFRLKPAATDDSKWVSVGRDPLRDHDPAHAVGDGAATRSSAGARDRFAVGRRAAGFAGNATGVLSTAARLMAGRLPG